MVDEREARLLEAAVGVFSRYGFRRTTMGDLAQAAGISRPALYLRYCNKERIFEAAFQRLADRILEEIQTGVGGLETPLEKLRFVFHVWVVRPYTQLAGSPDAKDLVDCSLGFAKDKVDACYARLEAELRRILEEASAGPEASPCNPSAIAHFMAAAARGFKASAASAEELRELLDDMIMISLAAVRKDSSATA